MKTIDLKNITEWPLTTRMLVIGLVCALVFYLGFIWDIAALRDQLTSIGQQENDAKTQLETVIYKESSLTNYTSQFAKLNIIYADWQKKLVNPKEVSETLNEILKLGANNQLQFSLFNPEDETKEDGYLKVPIKIVVLGSYHQIANFFSQIAAMKKIVAIENFIITNINLNPNNKTESNPDVLTAEIIFNVYYLAGGERHEN